MASEKNILVVVYHFLWSCSEKEKPQYLFLKYRGFIFYGLCFVWVLNFGRNNLDVVLN